MSAPIIEPTTRFVTSKVLSRRAKLTFLVKSVHSTHFGRLLSIYRPLLKPWTLGVLFLIIGAVYYMAKKKRKSLRSDEDRI